MMVTRAVCYVCAVFVRTLFIINTLSCLLPCSVWYPLNVVFALCLILLLFCFFSCFRSRLIAMASIAFAGTASLQALLLRALLFRALPSQALFLQALRSHALLFRALPLQAHADDDGDDGFCCNGKHQCGRYRTCMPLAHLLHAVLRASSSAPALAMSAISTELSLMNV